MPDLPGVDRRRIREWVDAVNFDEVIRALAAIQPDVVINCIGLVKQLLLSNDPLASLEINSLLPHRISLISRAAKIRMIHFSTDCVFSGKKASPYTEADQSDAEDLYGRTKFLGEVSYRPHALTLRTSIIGRELRTRHGLVEWLLHQRQAVKGYRKAIFNGFTTGAIADIILNYVLPNVHLTGVYNLSSRPIAKYDLLHLIKEAYGLRVEIEPDDDVTYNRVLDSSQFQKETGFKPQTWTEMIQAMQRDPTPYDSFKSQP
jgi:dTDP-4-dehydrorhamnose reductase